MPPLAIPSLPVLVPRDLPAGNATDIGLDVICAWPVSGQYGPGTRVLYYVLIAACVFARKEEWLRNACLAAALLFPAIAALHGIVLASIHVEGAIDMDVYGAFQLCSIGILTAPLTVRMSGTYFKDPRRNIIFLWTGLVLAGLLSVTVELFRAKTSICTVDDAGNPVSSDSSKFPYEEAQCNLRCSIPDGPFSRIRQGSTDEIYVVPAPNQLTFGTATLLAAACCVPAIVSLVYFWSLILRETWNNRYGQPSDIERRNEPIEGTNGATVGQMLQINGLVRKVLSTVEAPVFAGAVLAILVLGEKNFFSGPVDYGTEPIASIGQWAPIVGAGFAILGSLYLSLTGDEKRDASPCECTCHHDARLKGNPPTHPSTSSPSPTSSTDDEAIVPEMTVPASPEPSHPSPTRSATADIGNRRGINRALMRVATAVSVGLHDRLYDWEFTRGPAQEFPEIPAEPLRNRELSQIKESYNATNTNASLSRQGSTLSMVSWRDGDRSSSNSRGVSPHSLRQSPRSRSPSPMPSSSRGSGSGEDQSSLELQDVPPSPPNYHPPPLRTRRDTLEVPPHHPFRGRSPSGSSVSTTTFVPGSPTSPMVVVSDNEPSSTSTRRDAHPSTSFAPPEPEPPGSPGFSRSDRRFTS